MGFVPAKVSDVADIRECHCALPDDAPLSDVAMRLAELRHLPLCGFDSQPMRYGFVSRGGHALSPQSCFRDLHSHKPFELRLVPEFTVYSNEGGADERPAADDFLLRDESIHVEIGEERLLVQDDCLDYPPDVRIDARVHREIEGYAMQDRYTECAGLLLGSVVIQGQERVIHISAVAPAADARGDRNSVTMTLKGWESAFRIKDSEYAELRILGWFHTHPGSGVFLSDSDSFAHKNFFPNPNMAAYVLDPTTGRDGFFYWHNGVLGLRPSYGLVCTPDDTTFWNRLRIGPKALRVSAIALAVCGVLFLGFARPGRRASEPGKPVSVSVKSVSNVRKSVTRDATYTLGPRDNFWKICNRYYNDGDLAKALARYNGIRDLVHLQVGQKIKLPPKAELERLAGD